ncbi:MAG: hypothetical protein HY514_00240 [Candidatus Aenigmarchaeota archaeon]|nr:hypothetical protein [Candidatus Aenigmarchaeota archaeon]
MVSVFGAIGAIILIIAWLNEVYQIHKSRNVEAISLKFLLVYLLATILLFIHSVYIRDDVFTWLNTGLIIITLTEMELVIRKRHKKLRQKRANRS